MASNLPPQWVVFILTGILFLASSVNSIPTEELDSMLDTLRIRGYELFCNAIVTSDLQIEILYGKNDTRSHRSFTFFAPMDSSLFALDMTQSATSYIDTLRFHIVPRRLSITNLLGLPAGFSLPTLLFRRYLNVTQSPDRSPLAVSMSLFPVYSMDAMSPFTALMALSVFDRIQPLKLSLVFKLVFLIVGLLLQEVVSVPRRVIRLWLRVRPPALQGRIFLQLIERLTLLPVNPLMLIAIFKRRRRFIERFILQNLTNWILWK
ncbi:uncharacterized protein LOC129297108 [Prosopis cineraria]|uniref:uncharacterized protein LOC129297108 n=1 Tax=Prosopis cineraria TaxID=364024 RepID=UPI00241016B8|nr:uncharacterized protein LOC129297108 [Prosopis cineraria]